MIFAFIVHDTNGKRKKIDQKEMKIFVSIVHKQLCVQKKS